MSNSRNLSKLIASTSGKLSNINMASGSTVQVVTNKTSTQTILNTVAFTATSIAVDITPIFSDSKILIFGQTLITGTGSDVQSIVQPIYTLYRNGTDIVQTSYGLGNIYSYTGGYIEGMASFSFLDTPGSTTLATYRIYGRGNSGSTTYFGSTVRLSVITAMEIKS